MTKYYDIKSYGEGVFGIYEPSGVGAVLIVGQEKALLVDATYGFGNIAKAVGSLTHLPVEVLVTHGHMDHYGGSWAFDEMWFNMTDYDSYVWYQTTQRQLMVEKIERDRIAKGLPPAWPAGFSKEDYYGKDAAKMRPLKEGQIFDLGGRKETVYALPGHTRGSVVVMDDLTGLVFSGDSISDSQWMFFQWSAPVREYERGLRYIRSLPVKGIISAHRTCIFPPEIIDDQLYNLSTIDPGKDRFFVHPRTKVLTGLMHKSPCTCMPGINNVYVVYREDLI